MAAKYTSITLTEMTDLLTPEKGWHDATPPTAKEHVLHWRVKRYADTIVVKVYTSIATAHATGRGKGKDAIRVCAVNLDTDRGLVKAKRVHRVENWRTNLKSRILHVLAELKTRGFALAVPPQPVVADVPTVAPVPTVEAGHPVHCWCPVCMKTPPTGGIAPAHDATCFCEACRTVEAEAESPMDASATVEPPAPKLKEAAPKQVKKKALKLKSQYGGTA